jgi:hypothetical protein
MKTTVAVTSGDYLTSAFLFAPLLAILILLPKMQKHERRRVLRDIEAAGGLENWKKLLFG